jgi:hypothetical protein
MDWPDYLRDQATMYRQQAEQAAILSSKTNCLSWRLSVRKLPMTSRIIRRLGKNIRSHGTGRPA